MMKETIIKQTTHSEWTLQGPIDNYNNYRDFIQALGEAQEGDTIVIKINSPGGDADIGFMIVQAMQSSRAALCCEVILPSASMASIIALSGDWLLMHKHSYLMFHTYTGGAYGKSDDLVKDVTHTHAALVGLMNDACTPFFTKKELARIHKGEDIYIKWDDPLLEARIKKQWPNTEVKQ